MSEWIEYLGEKQVNWLRAHDQRAQLMVDLIKSWGSANIMGNIFAELHEQPHQQTAKVTIEQLVFLAADTAEKAYDEIERRGWQLKIPPYKEPPK